MSYELQRDLEETRAQIETLRGRFYETLHHMGIIQAKLETLRSLVMACARLNTESAKEMFKQLENQIRKGEL